MSSYRHATKASVFPSTNSTSYKKNVSKIYYHAKGKQITSHTMFGKSSHARISRWTVPKSPAPPSTHCLEGCVDALYICCFVIKVVSSGLSGSGDGHTRKAVCFTPPTTTVFDCFCNRFFEETLLKSEKAMVVT